MDKSDKSDKALFEEPFERKPGNFSEGVAPAIGYAPLNEAGPGMAGMDAGISAQRCIKVSGRISKKSRKMMRYSLECFTPDGQPIEHDIDGFHESGQQIVVEYNPPN